MLEGATFETFLQDLRQLSRPRGLREWRAPRPERVIRSAPSEPWEPRVFKYLPGAYGVCPEGSALVICRWCGKKMTDCGSRACQNRLDEVYKLLRKDRKCVVCDTHTDSYYSRVPIHWNCLNRWERFPVVEAFLRARRLVEVRGMMC